MIDIFTDTETFDTIIRLTVKYTALIFGLKSYSFCSILSFFIL